MSAEFTLLSATPAAWADAVAADVPALLSDHAHCELKAAASAMALLKRNADRPGLGLRLAPLIREESEHLHRVLRELSDHGRELGRDLPNPWAEGLSKAAREQRGGRFSYLDALLVSALIEMRSHERFACMRASAALAELHPLCDALGAAEERHGRLFVDLALEAHPADQVRERFDALAQVEARLIESVPFAYRVHSGPPGTG